MKRWIRGARIFTMGPQGTLEKGDILIENGKIAAIGEQLDCEDAEVIDAAGLTAIPGIVDAHSHIGGFERRMSMKWSGTSLPKLKCSTGSIRCRLPLRKRWLPG